MLLQDKTAIVYGAAGHIGSQVARTFAREGARLFLAGRTPDRLQALARELGADWATLDVLDEAAVERHAAGVAAKAGRIDVSLNAASIRGDLQGTPLLDMPLADFMAPVETGVRANFLTMRGAARHMVRQRRGVILALSATSAGLSGRDRVYHKTGGFAVACTAIEAMVRTFAGELGRHGVRVVCLRSDALPETWPPEAQVEYRETRDYMDAGTALGRLPRIAEVADAAAFAASDRAGAMTGAIVNLTCGSIMDAD
ncbi:SDR family oxidoreductase [Pigmentiphaga kullae]|uniref:NADP-dependent 3-hydroxy acid dehydrogenase YdfG n=1 Tax=Pigmentiphaga kullae TaxID=151784 RepID=A0A4Q7NIA3_9BURK|nr:SDR family oxidoreductase [Pigmentiphaga kullae]RZS84623.1 NADP-dependent 3-hydroxy acid dehydrogenase YdfG [Pigmentiphaga kullae]